MSQLLHDIRQHGIALGRGRTKALGVYVEILEQVLVRLLATDGIAALLHVTHRLTQMVRGKGFLVDFIVERGEGVLRLDSEPILFPQLVLQIFPVFPADSSLIDLLSLVQGLRLSVLQKIYNSIKLPVRQVFVEYQPQQIVLILISAHRAPHDISGVPKRLIQFL